MQLLWRCFKVLRDTWAIVGRSFGDHGRMYKSMGSYTAPTRPSLWGLLAPKSAVLVFIALEWQ